MEMHQVRYFLALAEELNFTRAAQRCHVSQPAITRAIKALEEELGSPLFHREHSRTYLTEFGRMLRPNMHRIVQETAEARRRADAYCTTRRAAIRLGQVPSIGSQHLVELIRSMKAGHAGIEFEVLDTTRERLIENLELGELDVAVLSSSEGLSDAYHVRPLYREHFVIAVGCSHPLAKCESIRVNDLVGESYLRRLHCEQGEMLRAMIQERGGLDRTAHASERVDWLLGLVAAGLGYAFLPEKCVEHPCVVARPFTEQEIWRDIALITVRGRPYSAPLAALLQHVDHIYRH